MSSTVARERCSRGLHYTTIERCFCLCSLPVETCLVESLDLGAQKLVLREQFGAEMWECRRILAELDRAEDLYIDSVSQIRMESWSRGRVVLVGDAAFCISLTGGQGSALAMSSAYVLSGELLEARGDHERAFRSYEQTLRPFIASKQRGAERFASAFAPKTHWGLWLRNQVIRAAAIPGVARLALSRDILDTLELPKYDWLGALTTRP